jgi:hypothetical protein
MGMMNMILLIFFKLCATLMIPFLMFAFGVSLIDLKNKIEKKENTKKDLFPSIFFLVFLLMTVKLIFLL